MGIKNWNAGIIRPVAVAPTASSAPGVWTLDQVAYWEKQGLWPKPPEPSWVSATAYTTTNYNARAYGAAGVYKGNAAYAGYTRGSGSYDKAAVAFYNTTGALQWSKSLSTATANQGIIYSTFFDTSGNVYVVGNDDGLGAFLYKFNSSGTQLAGYTLNVNAELVDGCVDSSGNIYLLARNSASVVTIKLNSSFAIQWQKAYTITGSAPYVSVTGSTQSKITVDSSGNVYATFSYKNDSSSIYEGYPSVIKYNSSGTLQWARSINGGGTYLYTQYASGVAVDSSGNVYVICTIYVDSPSFSNPIVTKFNSSGTWQWSKATGGGNYGYGLVIDASDNIYFAQSTSIYKMTSAASPVWVVGVADNVKGILLDSGAQQSLYAGTYNTNYWLAFKFNTNAIAAGTYTLGSTSATITFSTSFTLTDKTPIISSLGFSSSSSSFSLSAAGSSFANAGFTASTASLI